MYLPIQTILWFYLTILKNKLVYFIIHIEKPIYKKKKRRFESFKTDKSSKDTKSKRTEVFKKRYQVSFQLTFRHVTEVELVNLRYIPHSSGEGEHS